MLSQPIQSFLETYSAEFDDIKLKITDQNGIPLEIEDMVNLTLLINKKKWYVIFRTKSKKICQRISNFVIYKKSI